MISKEVIKLSLMNKIEIAKELKISEVTLDRLRKKGLPSHQAGRRVLFDYEEVLKWVKEDKVGK